MFASQRYPRAADRARQRSGHGQLMAFASACHLTNSAAALLSPRLAAMLFPSILVPAFIGELSFAVWLTVKGVDEVRWQEKAGRSIASS